MIEYNEIKKNLPFEEALALLKKNKERGVIYKKALGKYAWGIRYQESKYDISLETFYTHTGESYCDHKEQYLAPSHLLGSDWVYAEIKKPEVLVDFSEALKALKAGKKVRQKSWCAGEYVFLRDGYIEDEDRGFVDEWTTEVLLANNWIILE